MKNTYLALVLLAAIFCPFISRASHAQGADLAYKFVSYNPATDSSYYLVTTTFYRDCSGIPISPSMALTIKNTGCSGGIYSHVVNLPMINGLPCPFGGVSGSTGCEVSHLCTNVLSQSTCGSGGGIYPGMQKYVYSDTISLPGSITAGHCDNWVISVEESARNPSNNVTATGDLYIQAVINNTIDPQTSQPYQNSSPVFQNDPVPFVCLNTASPLAYNNGTIEQDGDSIVYMLTNPLQGPNIPLTFSAGYTVHSPIASSIPCTFDSLTGILTYKPSQTDVDVLAYLVKEYRRGVLVGSTMRDVQIKILSCNEDVPTISTPVIVQGGVLADSATITGCPGDHLIADISATNLGLTNIDLQSSINLFPQSYSGMTFTQMNTGAAVTGRIEWLSVDTVCRYVYIKASSNDCPVQSVGTKVIKICGKGQISITPQSPVYCGRAVTLTGSGGANPIWTPVAGLSTTTALSTQASPTVSTWYHLQTACSADSVFVRVSSPLTGSITHDTSACNGIPLQISESVSGGGQLAYTWTPAYGLYDPSTGNADNHIANPIVKNSQSTTYHCLVTDSSGCAWEDSVRVTVHGQGQLSVTGDTLVLASATANLSATFSSFAQPCSTMPDSLVTQHAQVQVGTGTAVQGGSFTMYPSPFGNYYKSARHQILYKASELQALFGSSRIINSLSLEIGTLNQTSTLVNFTVKIACVSADSLIGYLGTNALKTVYTRNYTPNLGWNTMTFDQAYVWDGVSDLIVDLCFQNTTSNNMNNKLKYTPTSFRSVWCTYGNDPSGQCGYTGTQQGIQMAYATCFQRFNTKFGLADVNSVAGFSWSPSTGTNAVANAYTSNTSATVHTDQWYTANLSDSVCPQSDSVLVRVITTPTFTPFHRDLCLGDSIHVFAYGASSYAWSDANGVLSTNSSFNYAPTQNSVLILVMTDVLGNIVNDTSYVNVLDQRVWPGDADDNGVADYTDMLYVGIAFGDTGSVRPASTQVWVEQCAYSWDSTFVTGTNCVHADCDGDGVVGFSDTLAIIGNLGQTHSKTMAGRASNYNLNITTDKQIYNVNDTIIASISMGDANSPLPAIYGIAYTFDYSSHGVTHIIDADQSMSWINGKLIYRKMNGLLSASLVQARINHTDTAGYGQIARIRLTVDGVTSITDSGHLQAIISLALGKSGDTVYLNAATKAIAINGALGIDNIGTDQSIEIYPNPNKGIFTITQYSTAKVNMVMLDAIGREVYSRVISDHTTNLDLSMMPDGVYVVSLSGMSGKTTKRLVIAR